MKKTLQINIGGLFFTIEEDAYQQLSQYLNDLKKYFSTYESCEEIIQDIEARIAEKFYEKQQTVGIIEMADVQQIMASMGNVSDFEAVKEEEDLHVTPPASTTGWYRDGKRKALGGVLAGIAHKYKFDVIWARMLFLVFAFGLIGEGIGPAILLTYFILWIFLPVRHDLEDLPTVRKFYRNPEDKVIGGVASGLATYIGMDVKIMRIIFVVSAVLVVPVLLYFLLWILAPLANSVTQKLQLEGQALTIQNIEKSVKSKEEETPKTESALSKILLFPFRLIGLFFSFLGKMVTPIAKLLKIITGLVLIFTGICSAFAVMVGLGAFFGMLDAVEWIQTGDVEFHQFLSEIPPLGAVFAFFALFIPALALIFAGVMLVVGKAIGTRNFWLTLLLIWMTGLVGSISVGTKISLNYAHRENVQEELNFTPNANQVLLFDIPYDYESNTKIKPEIEITGTNLDKIYITRTATSNGPSSNKARLLAKNIGYKIIQKDSALSIDPYLTVGEDDPFRNQSLKLEVEIPKGKPFRFSKRYLEYLHMPYPANRMNYKSTGDNIFVFNEDNEIQCLNCPIVDPYTTLESSDKNYDQDFEGWEGKGYRDTLLLNFNEIKVSEKYHLVITQGEKQQIVVATDMEEAKNNAQIKVKNGELNLSYVDPFRENARDIYVWITTPRLSKLDISSGSALKLYGFDVTNPCTIQVSDKSSAAIHMEAKYLNLNVANKSDVRLKGQIENLKVDIDNSSILRAQESKVETATVTAKNSSVAEMGNTKIKRYNASKDSLIKNIED
jgi:phage shock protein PspC (stress-responsive transcriptional regulator)